MKRKLIVALLALVLACEAVWFYLHIEFVPTKEYVGFKGEARRNPFLAVSRFLEKLDVKYQRVDRVEKLDHIPLNATLFMTDHRQSIIPARASKLLDWVKQGGHLIIEAEYPGTKDVVLDILKVDRKWSDYSSNRMEPTKIRLARPDKEFNVVFSNRMSLEEKEFDDEGVDEKGAKFSAGNTFGTQLLQFDHGRGLITVVTALNFLTNFEIANYDHAEFFNHLLYSDHLHHAVTGPVWFVYDIESPSLWNWLIENAVIVLLVALLLLLAWLWRIIPRFGPVAPDSGHARRNLLEHIVASGWFQWRHDNQALLLASAREACLKKIHQARPDYGKLLPVHQDDYLAQVTQLKKTDIWQALHTPPRTREEFVTAIRTLQDIQFKLTKDYFAPSTTAKTVS